MSNQATTKNATATEGENMIAIESTTLDTWKHERLGTTGERYYLAAFRGAERLGHVRSNWWAVCPDANAGLGISYCCGPDTRIYSEAALVETFGNLANASRYIKDAGGHMPKALAAIEYMRGVASSAANMARLEADPRYADTGPATG